MMLSIKNFFKGTKAEEKNSFKHYYTPLLPAKNTM